MITQTDHISEEILNLIVQKRRPVSIAEVNSYFDNNEELTQRTVDFLLGEGQVHLIKNGKDKYLCNC